MFARKRAMRVDCLRFGLALAFSLASVSGQKVDPYADAPYWYKPGHPLTPAEPAGIQAPEGFKLEKAISIPAAVGSISSMTTDPDGNLLVAMQHRPGIYRVTLSSISSEKGARLDRLGGEAAKIGWAQGLLWAFDSLYVTVAEQNESKSPGLYRLMDTNGDGVFDEMRVLFQLRGKGEHGPHGLTLAPDGKSLYMICGNGTPIPEEVDSSRVPVTEGLDHLMPTGFESSSFADAGWVYRFDQDGSNPELIASGLRNSYDLAFNQDGELFTFDSDMEYDLGTPWYRPTRICHLTSGGHFGWRANAAKWPEWYEDSLPPVANVGPGSPTGLVFGYATRFPEHYRNALFALDWTYATIYAVRLEPDGASYTASVEPFVSGLGLPLTDAVVGGDGALYFSVGGRRLGSAIYRVSYEGPRSASTSPRMVVEERGARPARDLRKQLERFHGKTDPSAVGMLWPHLKSPDRRLRYAARVALESQPLSMWKERVFSEPHAFLRLNALLALARMGSASDLARVVDGLNGMNLANLQEGPALLALRVYEVAMARGEEALKEKRSALAIALVPVFPHSSALVNRELARSLCFIGESAVIDPILDYMEASVGSGLLGGYGLVARNPKYASALLGMAESPPMVERMHFTQMLNWIEEGWTLEQNRRRFRLIVDAMQRSKGGNGYIPGWRTILDTAKSRLPEREMEILAAEWLPLDAIEPLPQPEGPGRIWELDYLIQRLEKGFGLRDFEKGQSMYAAATCVTCHSVRGSGGAAGPDLTSIGQRFTVKDLIDSIIHPGKAISDQYQTMVIQLKTGETLSGRLLSRGVRRTLVATNALDPSQTRSLLESEIADISPLPTSTMPPGLLNALNEEEALDLIAYLVAGGDPEHSLYDERPN